MRYRLFKLSIQMIDYLKMDIQLNKRYLKRINFLQNISVIHSYMYYLYVFLQLCINSCNKFVYVWKYLKIVKLIIF